MTKSQDLKASKTMRVQIEEEVKRQKDKCELEIEKKESKI